MKKPESFEEYLNLSMKEKEELWKADRKPEVSEKEGEDKEVTHREDKVGKRCGNCARQKYNTRKHGKPRRCYGLCNLGSRTFEVKLIDKVCGDWCKKL